uniref:Ubiquitin-protein ligase E3C n=1 Tax=Cacopsylla melanoneura TaxID=428564 RepID=A0A8D8U9V2_9HEMI
MSSFFEGQYRRTPEQNLSGVNYTESREQFLHRAHLERQKREDNRRRFLCSIKIQSFVRSYLVRKRIKQKEREEFAQILSANKNSVTLDTLNILTRKLLFFYHPETDHNYLISVSKLLLDKQFKATIVELTFYGPPTNTVWSLRTRKLLLLNLMLMRDKAGVKEFNNTVSLRLLEVFTKFDEIERYFSQQCHKQDMQTIRCQFINLLKYLIQNRFYAHLRVLLDAKVPPLLEPTTTPPTPLSQCLFDLLVTPLGLIGPSQTCDPHYSVLVMEELIRHIVLEPMTEPIKLYILPSLSHLNSFPYQTFIQTIHSNMKKNIRYTTGSSPSDTSPSSNNWLSNVNLLYALLSLDNSQTYLTNQSLDLNQVSAHLFVLGHASSQLVRLSRLSEDEEEEGRGGEEDPTVGGGGGEDWDMEKGGHLTRNEEQLLLECCTTLNENRFVQGVLSVVDRFHHQEQVLQPLCQLCHHLLMSHKLACHRFRLLHMLALNHKFIRSLYNLSISIEQKAVFSTTSTTTLLAVISRGSQTNYTETQQIVPLLATFCSLFSLLVTTLHDTEFYADPTESATQSAGLTQEQLFTNQAGGSIQENKMPFSLVELVSMTSVFKNVVLGLIELAYPDSRLKDTQYRHHSNSSSTSKSMVAMWCHLFKSLVSLLRQLHSRDSRRRFTPSDAHWCCPQLSGLLGSGFDQPGSLSLRQRERQNMYRPFHGLPNLTREELEDGPPLSTKEIRTLTILHEVPFLVGFQERVLVFQRVVLRDKMNHQSRASFLQGPQIQISVRRNYIYEDAFDKLSPENEPELRHVMRVQLINAVGLDEAGIDGGGLFREFLSELLKTAFDPKLGFFKLTEDNLLYPNPGVGVIHNDYLKHYYFIGRMLGKALYENLLVELPLADLFLSKLVSRHADVDIHHLATLDAMLYRNLLYLKHYEDVTDLGLDFTVLCDELGERRIIELKPQGSNIPVTNVNRIEYIHLVADYYLNRRIRAQCNAFKQGLSDVIPPAWLQMFNSRELQTLISGAEIRVDLEDLRAHTAYLGGYTSDHATIQMFWEVVNKFTDSQRRALLKFVTSCSRPPLLGFKELDPPFGIQLINAEDRLPSASTCMNLLKLPKFQDQEKLRERLVYAISSDCGFELS